jgi:hypothetical protein
MLLPHDHARCTRNRVKRTLCVTSPRVKELARSRTRTALGGSIYAISGEIRRGVVAFSPEWWKTLFTAVAA